jgi:hypothetical protein
MPHIIRWKKFIVRGGYIESQLSALSHLCAPALEMLVLDCTSNETEMELFTGETSRLSSLELIRANF